ncbi:unnamed protein product, partial [Choristocarpus tenellus]
RSGTSSSWKKTTASAGGGRTTGAGVCALCTDRTPGRWITRCKGAGRKLCQLWAHPSCAWENEGYAVRSLVGGKSRTGGAAAVDVDREEARVPAVFFACPEHDKPPTYCSCGREEGDQGKEEEEEDYIECESCCEWYHFSCEGLDETSPPDPFSCKRCKKLALAGKSVSEAERRRNQAKTNDYESEMVWQSYCSNI